MSRIQMILMSMVLILVLLIAGGALAVYFFTKGITPTLPALPAQPAVVTPGEQIGRGTLVTLRADETAARECLLRFGDNDFAYTEGTAFVADGQLRADVLTPTNMVTSVVLTQSERYEWNPGTLVTQATTSESALTMLPVSYTCRPWTVDGSVFVAPIE